jgi:hypothetical protein
MHLLVIPKHNVVFFCVYILQLLYRDNRENYNKYINLGHM